MNFERLYRIHRLIEMEATGPPSEFAKRFLIKRRQLFYLLEELKSYGAVIKYNSIKSTYSYLEDFNFFEKTGLAFFFRKESEHFLKDNN